MKSIRITMLALFLSAIQVLSANNEKLSIAVRDLTAQGLKESEAAVISEQLRAELMNYPEFKLVERNQMQEILKEQGFQQSGCTSDACAVEVGQLLGVQNMVVGSIGKAGSYTVLSVRVIDVSTGNIIENESIRTKGGIDEVLEEGIRDAAEKLHSSLFPDIKDTEKKETVKKKRNPAKAIIIGSSAALLIGGGIAGAAILTNDDKNEEDFNTPNTRITLP